MAPLPPALGVAPPPVPAVEPVLPEVEPLRAVVVEVLFGDVDLAPGILASPVANMDAGEPGGSFPSRTSCRIVGICGVIDVKYLVEGLPHVRSVLRCFALSPVAW